MTEKIDLEKQLQALRVENKALREELEANAEEKNIALKNERDLIALCVALSAEKNQDALLEQIVFEARRRTNADGGTLYLRNGEVLEYHIVQYSSMNIRMGGISGVPIPFPPLAMNESNVSCYSALKGNSVNIEDLYHATESDFSGSRNFDTALGYRSKSILVIPLQNNQNEIIGVLELLNSAEPATGEVIPFSQESEFLGHGLASLAAISLAKT